MGHQKQTFCRICEPTCPLIAEFNDLGDLIQLVPGLDHPSGGVACHKGLSFLDVHNDPDRLNWPLKRLNVREEAAGEFVERDWDSAFGEIGERLRALRSEHGSSTVAFFLGNPAAFNAAGLVFAGEFQDLIDTKMRFSSNTQDAACKFTAAEAVYGSASSFMVPDIYNTQYLLCIGANPKVSKWTLMSAPNDPEVLKQIVARGGKVRFVNPRKTESSTSETGPTILIKPGTDVYFLAAILNEIEATQGFDTSLMIKYGKRALELKKFIQQYPAEKVAHVTGIEAAAIKMVARELLTAESAAVYMSTGVNQSRQGILSVWLVEMINFITGNLGRLGGVHKPTGLINHFPPVAGVQTIDTSLGRMSLPDPVGFSVLPAVLLPDLIENGDIRALIIIGGNPLLSVGGEDRMREACGKLAIMVTVDIYRSATAELSDFVLPATDWLERPDINLLGSGMQPLPYVQYTDAMTPPAAARRDEWWILARLAQAVGAPSPLDHDPTQSDGSKVLEGLLAARDLSIDKLRAEPWHTVSFPQEPRETVFDWCLQHPDGKINCCPEAFDSGGLLERCHAIFAELDQEPADVLKLISLRTPYIHNTWFANSGRFRRGKHSINPLNMCEVDAARRGLHNGQTVRVTTEYGSIDAQLIINNDMRPGAVAMSHGFGNRQSRGLKVALRNPGANCNALMPVGPGSFEPLSYMSWLSGVPVQVEKITMPRDQSIQQVSPANTGSLKA